MLFVRKDFNRQRNYSRKLEFLILINDSMIFDICCSIINLPVILNVKNISQFVCLTARLQSPAPQIYTRSGLSQIPIKLIAIGRWDRDIIANVRLQPQHNYSRKPVKVS